MSNKNTTEHITLSINPKKMNEAKDGIGNTRRKLIGKNEKKLNATIVDAQSAWAGNHNIPPGNILSPGERQAETIYNLCREGRMGKRTLRDNYQVLQQDSPLGALYLIWLFSRGMLTDKV